MRSTGELNRRARRTAATRIRWMAEEIVLDRLRDGEPEFDREVDQVAEMSTDPLQAAKRLIGAI
jgi:LAO/AO transport system kinase